MDEAILADYFGVALEQIHKWRFVDGGAKVRALINYGVGGVKVHVEPVENFIVTADEPEPETELELPSVYELNYRELQAIAKKYEIPANQTKDDLIAALDAIYDEEE